MNIRQFFVGRAIGFLVVLVILGVVGGVSYLSKHGKTPPGQVFCTEEALLCPDGSYVARSGEKCEFSACPEVKGDVTLGVVKVGETAAINGLRITLNYLVSGATTANVTLKSDTDTDTLFLNNDKDATAFDSYKVSIVSKTSNTAIFKVTVNKPPMQQIEAI